MFILSVRVEICEKIGGDRLRLEDIVSQSLGMRGSFCEKNEEIIST